MRTKKMKTLSFIILTFLGAISINAQNFEGQIFDVKTKEPIPYVNIGIIKKGIGTVSDENGNFSLKLEDRYKDDSIKISMIGYKYISLKVQDAKSKYKDIPMKLYLEESSFELDEVVVRPLNYKTAIVGNKDNGHASIIFMGDSTKQFEGYEVGTLIKIKKRSTYIDKISFGVYRSDYDSITIRLNVYNAKTNENILKQPIYVTVYKDDKVVSVDTKKYSLKVNDDFIIAFEALEILQTKQGKGKSTEKKFSFNAGFGGSDMLVRTNIYDKWRKVPVVVVGFNATISYVNEGNWFTNFFK